MFEQKILCIGSETEQTDFDVFELAQAHQSQNWGLITDQYFEPKEPGFYHTSIADIPSGAIVVNLVRHFDSIKMLDQSMDTYPHFKSFVNTFRMMLLLEDQQHTTVFRDNKHNQSILHWHSLLRENKSLCLYPFINLVTDSGSAVMCQKVSTPVAKISNILDWSTDPSFAPIRNNMLAGIKMPDRCSLCYDREALGQESARQFESLEWAMNLQLTDVDDIKKIVHPILYEIRPSNKCNIMCRMCDDLHSHLIEEENKKIGIPISTMQQNLQDFPYEKINFESAKQIYWAGGEPTIMPEFYKFLRACIKNKTTNFNLCIGTNAVKISDTLLDLLDHFEQVTFSVSFDGYGIVNDYIRWGTNFQSLKHNCKRILERKHSLAFQTVFSMYNATRIHEVYEFYDREFPGCNTLVQPAQPAELLGPWDHPFKEKVLESMYRCQNTQVYYNNGRNTNSLVEEMIDRYSNHHYDINVVRAFFDYNDKLDKSRGSKLEDYIPELAMAKQVLD